jgi:hypothetical protein
MIEDFSICHGERHQWCTLSFEYLRKFSKKFGNGPNLIVYSGARGKLIHEKTRSRKSRDTVPLSDQQIDISSSRIFFKEKGILKVDSEIIYYSCRKNYGCANQAEKIVQAMIFFCKNKRTFYLNIFQANK